jgi:hypothetical protein
MYTYNKSSSGLPPFSPSSVSVSGKHLLIQQNKDKDLLIQQKEEIEYLKRQFQLIKANSGSLIFIII